MVWVPCEVRGGPFPDERMVYIESKVGEWFGFVNVSELEIGFREGKIECEAQSWRLNRVPS